MKRVISRLVAAFLFAASLSLVTGATGVGTPAAQAYCPPPNDVWTIYKFRDVSKRYHATNIKSDWVTFPRGGTISYSKNRTATLSVSTTATVSAEAGIIFAKASASIGVTVGGSWSRSETWTYSANVPADRDHMYRLHMYHYSAFFSVMKKRWSVGDCRYKNNWGRWQRVKHVPAKANRNVWRLDRRAA